ncbi:hypothetical protein GY45DRAFT_1262531 [Cubamyces sp. BRFM 1775]|nr:hypothetical protein GY45DRAFT_1262531 [Cubamyces sp. BRFM 1775]
MKAYIDSAVLKAYSDLVGRPDFALQANGARLLAEITSGMHDRRTTAPKRSLPEDALSDDLRIGHCWTFEGSKAQLGVKLSELVYPSHFSIDHIPASIATDIRSAPRAIVLWGAVDGPVNEQRLLVTPPNTTLLASIGRSSPGLTYGFVYVPLAVVEYDIYAATHVQTFPLDSYVAQSGVDFGIMVFEILSNWGGETTSLYRVRLHGEPIRSHAHVS